LMRMKGETFTPPDIIFTSGYTYPKYLLKAFEVGAIDYLVKPVSPESLKRAVTRYRERAEVAAGLQKNRPYASNEDKLMKFKSNNGFFFFHPDDIVYVEADRDYACMFLANGAKEDIFERLGAIEKKLPPELFWRMGRSFIINRKYIRKITDNTLQLVTPSANYAVEISRYAMRQLKIDLY